MALFSFLSDAQQAGAPSSSPQILGQNLGNLIQPYVGYITFGLDVSAGIIIGISAMVLHLPVSGIISIITTTIDVMAAMVILISVISTIRHVLGYTINCIPYSSGSKGY